MRFSLGAKFTLTVAIILIATMAANTFYFLGTAARFHEQQLVERGRALGHLISLISPDAILNFDFLLLNHYTREVSSGGFKSEVQPRYDASVASSRRLRGVF